ncbi:MAG: NAD(P)H-dependent oxidoreductase subunit E [Oscillospiraceae bacterium]|nr:NAD(P)H-dependent oxidoreductase subunit E [Oscillospiraceae bacterium]
MAKNIATIPFTGTAAQEQELRATIDALREDPGCLMPIMQKAQEIYGYLPIEVQRIISEELNIPIEKVFGVATFYAQFTMSPKGKYRISVCLGTACYVKGSGVVMEKLEEALGIGGGQITQDGRFSLDDCRCVGACGLAPVVTINDDVYGRLTGKPEEIAEILAKYAD